MMMSLTVVTATCADARRCLQSQSCDGEQLQDDSASESATITHQHQLSQRR